MSGPIKFMILAIVIGIKKSRCVCFVRKLCSVQSIHTELAELYSKKVISRVVCPAGSLGEGSSIPQAFLVRRSGIKTGLPVVLNKWKDVYELQKTYCSDHSSYSLCFCDRNPIAAAQRSFSSYFTMAPVNGDTQILLVTAVTRSRRLRGVVA